MKLVRKPGATFQVAGLSDCLVLASTSSDWELAVRPPTLVLELPQVYRTVAFALSDSAWGSGRWEVDCFCTQ